MTPCSHSTQRTVATAGEQPPCFLVLQNPRARRLRQEVSTMTHSLLHTHTHLPYHSTTWHNYKNQDSPVILNIRHVKEECCFDSDFLYGQNGLDWTRAALSQKFTTFHQRCFGCKIGKLLMKAKMVFLIKVPCKCRIFYVENIWSSVEGIFSLMHEKIKPQRCTMAYLMSHGQLALRSLGSHFPGPSQHAILLAIVCCVLLFSVDVWLFFLSVCLVGRWVTYLRLRHCLFSHDSNGILRDRGKSRMRSTGRKGCHRSSLQTRSSLDWSIPPLQLYNDSRE